MQPDHHALCCECDRCLNGAPATAQPPRTYKDGEVPHVPFRGLGLDHERAQLELEKARARSKAEREARKAARS